MPKISKYFSELQVKSPKIAERYTAKINLIDGMDPFTLQDQDLNFSAESFPPVLQLDIVTYLISTTSYYTNKQMKAFKSLEAYKYFKTGFVQKFGSFKIRNFIVVVGKVNHSQSLNLPPVDVWIICAEDGSINTAHCTCVAGAGEVCSHVAAILYALEYVYDTLMKTSATDISCQWNVPTFTNVEYSKIKDMDLTKVAVPKLQCNIPALEGEELQDILSKIQNAGSSAVIMRFIEPFSSEIAAELESGQGNYKLMYDIYKPEYEDFSYDRLLEIAENVSFNLTVEECEAITMATVKQRDCPRWHQERIGRITASKFKSVCHTTVEKPSLTVIKEVCYTTRFKSKYTEWGIKHEPDALAQYTEMYANSHENMEIVSVGLCLRPDLPQFGASPDALVRFKCCGIGCVEIKCPFNLKEMDLVTFANQKTSCLIKVGDTITLDKSHSYYYQVQFQMKMSGAEYCDFVVWSRKEIFCERVLFDEDFWLEKSEIARNFHRRIILPELLGRYFTRNIANTAIWCICETFEDGKAMLCCENEDCHRKWYHLECVGLTIIPNDFWFCDECAPHN